MTGMTRAFNSLLPACKTYGVRAGEEVGLYTSSVHYIIQGDIFVQSPTGLVICCLQKGLFIGVEGFFGHRTSGLKGCTLIAANEVLMARIGIPDLKSQLESHQVRDKIVSNMIESQACLIEKLRHRTEYLLQATTKERVYDALVRNAQCSGEAHDTGVVVRMSSERIAQFVGKTGSAIRVALKELVEDQKIQKVRRGEFLIPQSL